MAKTRSQGAKTRSGGQKKARAPEKRSVAKKARKTGSKGRKGKPTSDEELEGEVSDGKQPEGKGNRRKIKCVPPSFFN
jgi:hypothetical protein